jgi:quercetin dioxygenase-like cupin family protein
MAFIDTTPVRRFAAEKLQKLNLFETAEMFCDVYCLEPGQAQKPHGHPGATKFYFVLEGAARFRTGDEERELGPGGPAWAAPGEEHGVAHHPPARAAPPGARAPNPTRSQ